LSKSSLRWVLIMPLKYMGLPAHMAAEYDFSVCLFALLAVDPRTKELDMKGIELLPQLFVNGCREL
jgi:hypothetical protein